jgi:hypothetical protein
VSEEINVASQGVHHRGDVLPFLRDIVGALSVRAAPMTAAIHQVYGESLGERADHRRPAPSIGHAAVNQHQRRPAADLLETNDGAVPRLN